jgi:hypothetical protein
VSTGVVFALSRSVRGYPPVIGVIGGYQQGGDTPWKSYAAKFESNISILYQLAIKL